MRINKYVALATGLSRRSADDAIRALRVTLNQNPANLGDNVAAGDKVAFDGRELQLDSKVTTIMLNKPAGYVTSRSGQGSKTVYDLLPGEYHRLKPVGRLDKDSSGLLLLTNDGNLANRLTHPRYQKSKIYQVKLNKPLEREHENQLLTGVVLSDGLSKFIKVKQYSATTYEVTLTEGRNRQIRRTFNSLGYKIAELHRNSFGTYSLGSLPLGRYKTI